MEYQPDQTIGREVDSEGVLESIRDCKEPEVTRTPLGRQKIGCPAIHAHMKSFPK